MKAVKEISRKSSNKKEDTSNAKRSMLIEQVASKNRDLGQQKVEQVMRDMIDEIANHLINGQGLAFRQLGTWRLKTRRAKTARNPKTGEMLIVRGRETIHYKPSRYIFNLLNPHIKKSDRTRKAK